jgi:catalase-peroxidase
MILAGNVALESMGFKTFGFAGGRADVWEPERTSTGAGAGVARTVARRQALHSGDRDLENPLAAVQMGLIYVNPEGPNGNPDRSPRPRHPRDLRPHGHERRGDRRPDRRRPHLRQDPRRRPAEHVGPEPEAPLEEQGLGWKSTFGSGKGGDTISSGLEGAWTTTPTVEQQLLLEPVRLRVGADQEPGRRAPVGAQARHAGAGTVPDAHDPSKRHAPMMLTTDLALRFDPAYEKISRRFLENPGSSPTPSPAPGSS